MQLPIVSVDDYPAEVSSRTIYIVPQERDRRYVEVHVPTEVFLRGVLCRVDADQDPEQLICQYVGQEVGTGDGIQINTSTLVGADQVEAVDTVLVDEDWEFETAP
jgi:hypothetical protein